MKDFNYDPDIYTLSDENGEQKTFELLDTYDEDGVTYYAMVPVYDEPVENIEGDAELVVLRLDVSDGEEILVTIDDDDEYERIGNIFLERLDGYYDGDDDDFDEEYPEE